MILKRTHFPAVRALQAPADEPRVPLQVEAPASFYPATRGLHGRPERVHSVPLFQFTLGPFQPKKTLTRLVDAHQSSFLNTYTRFSDGFSVPVGSFAHLLALSNTHLWNALNPADPAFNIEKLRLQVLLSFTNPTTLNYECLSHVTPTCLRRMLFSLSTTEPYPWTCVPAPRADQVLQVLDYFFCFHDSIEGYKTMFVFWRYRVNEILAEDDIIPDDPAEIALRQKGYPSTAALRTEQ